MCRGLRGVSAYVGKVKRSNEKQSGRDISMSTHDDWQPRTMG